MSSILLMDSTIALLIETEFPTTSIFHQYMMFILSFLQLIHLA